VVSDARVRHG